MKTICIPVFDQDGGQYQTTVRGDVYVVPLGRRRLKTLVYRDWHKPDLYIVTHYGTGYRLAAIDEDTKPAVQDAVTRRYKSASDIKRLFSKLDSLEWINE